MGPRGPVELDQRARVIVAVDDELRTVPRQHGAKIGAVDQPFEAPRRRADRRMMDHDDAKQTLAAQRSSSFGKPRESARHQAVPLP